MQRKVSFKNNLGLLMRGIVAVPKGYNPKTGTAIVLLHGFPGSGLGERSKKLATVFEKVGILCLRFDFSGSNNSEGHFENKLMSQEVKETRYAINFVQKNFGFKKLVLLGHSTGAIDASLYGYTDKRINKLIISGGVSDLKHAARYDFTDEQVRNFWIKGYITYKRRKDWGKSWVDGKRLKKAFYDEFFKLDIPGSMKKYKRQLLVIHGEDDEAVPVKEAKELYANCNHPKKLVIIKNANHQYMNTRKTFSDYSSALVKFVKNN